MPLRQQGASGGVSVTALADEVSARESGDSGLSSDIAAENASRLAEVDTERKRVDALRVESDDMQAGTNQPGGVVLLDGGGKLAIQHLPLSTVVYCGIWNASTNTPPIASGHSPMGAGCYRVVSVAGTTPIDGESDWKIKDWIIWNGTVWSKVDNTESVTAVNGLQGAVSLGLGDLDGVSVSSVNNGEILQYTASGWVNNTLAEAGIMSAGQSVLNNATLNGTTNVSNLNLNSQKVKLGSGAGQTGPGQWGVSIGNMAAQLNQGNYAVGLGDHAGHTTQGMQCIAIGRDAGRLRQVNSGIAVGAGAGQIDQQPNAIAIGQAAGFNTQGALSIAIGNSAGAQNQPARTICINATGNVFNPTVATDALYIKPIRPHAGTHFLKYHPDTGEITYSV